MTISLDPPLSSRVSGADGRGRYVPARKSIGASGARRWRGGHDSFMHRYARANPSSSFTPAPGAAAVAFATGAAAVRLSSSGGFSPKARALSLQFEIVPSLVDSASRGAFFSRSRRAAAAAAAAFFLRSMRQRRWRPISALQKASEAKMRSSFAMSVARGPARFYRSRLRTLTNVWKAPPDLESRR